MGVFYMFNSKIRCITIGTDSEYIAIGNALSSYSSVLRSKLAELHELRITYEEIGTEDWIVDCIVEDIAKYEDLLESVSSLRDKVSSCHLAPYIVTYDE